MDDGCSLDFVDCLLKGDEPGEGDEGEGDEIELATSFNTDILDPCSRLTYNGGGTAFHGPAADQQVLLNRFLFKPLSFEMIESKKYLDQPIPNLFYLLDGLYTIIKNHIQSHLDRHRKRSGTPSQSLSPSPYSFTFGEEEDGESGGIFGLHQQEPLPSPPPQKKKRGRKKKSEIENQKRLKTNSSNDVVSSSVRDPTTYTEVWTIDPNSSVCGTWLADVSNGGKYTYMERILAANIKNVGVRVIRGQRQLGIPYVLLFLAALAHDHNFMEGCMIFQAGMDSVLQTPTEWYNAIRNFMHDNYKFVRVSQDGCDFLTSSEIFNSLHEQISSSSIGGHGDGSGGSGGGRSNYFESPNPSPGMTFSRSPSPLQPIQPIQTVQPPPPPPPNYSESLYDGRRRSTSASTPSMHRNNRSLSTSDMENHYPMMYRQTSSSITPSRFSASNTPLSFVSSTEDASPQQILGRIHEYMFQATQLIGLLSINANGTSGIDMNKESVVVPTNTDTDTFQVVHPPQPPQPPTSITKEKDDNDNNWGNPWIMNDDDESTGPHIPPPSSSTAGSIQSSEGSAFIRNYE